MASYKTNLETVRSQIVEQLIDMTENPKPNYSGTPGVIVDWGTHFNNLMSALEQLETRIQRAGGPIWSTSRAKT